MAEEGTLCSNGDVLKKCGANASATSSAEACTNVYIKESEGYISTVTRYDWVTNYSSVSTIGKEILRECTAALAAIKVINYDMSGFSTRTEAQTMVDILYSMAIDCLNILKEDKGREFVKNGTT